jgi:haloacetate dehalogenase
MFDGFDTLDVEVDDGRGQPMTIHGVTRGEGPPVLLLHGYPQTHATWHAIAPELAKDHTVVATDLRGYGDSGRPVSDQEHSPYAFRAMAADQVAVMRALGYDRFAVVGHDRGARVTHRMALDHPDQVERLALLDILPTAHVYGTVDQTVATAYFHWFFLVQAEDLPERLIAADPLYFLHRLLAGFGGSLDIFHPEALARYERAFADPDVRHAMIEDYRAGASIDLRHDAESAAEGRAITARTLVLWGGKGLVGARPGENPLDVWRSRASEDSLVTGRGLPGVGHYLPEEGTEQVLAELRTFLAEP